jgi:hypothetical protein
MANHGMNESTQKRQIQRFLKGNDKRDIDAFSIYQWIERCHIQEWWQLAIELSTYITPSSLNIDYQKRLDFILKDCRNKREMLDGGKELVETIIVLNGLLRHPTRRLPSDSGSPSVSHLSREELHFDNHAKETLRQIYSVLYYMKRNHDFVDAVKRTKDQFHVRYQTVDDKCARRFAGTVEIFQRWYRNGEILQRLRDHFHLTYRDYSLFETLLGRK